MRTPCSCSHCARTAQRTVQKNPCPWPPSATRRCEWWLVCDHRPQPDRFVWNRFRFALFALYKLPFSNSHMRALFLGLQLAPAVLQATLVEKNKLVRSNVRGQAPRSTTFQSTRTFAFDAAFPPSAETSDVFETEVLPLVEVVASGGGSCCVMAYGATGFVPECTQ